MSDQNSYHFTGRLTRDIQLTHTSSGTAVADVGIAIGRKFKDKEETVFLDLRVWGAMGELWNKHLHKGSFVIASGRLELDQWTGQDGAKRSKIRCVVESFTFPPLPNAGHNNPPAGENYPESDQPPQPGVVSGPPRGEPVADSEIPFD